MYHSPNLRLYRVYIQLFSTLFSIFSFFFFVLCYFFSFSGHFVRLQRCPGEILIQKTCPRSCLFLSFFKCHFLPGQWRASSENLYWKQLLLDLEARAAFAPESPPPLPKSSLAGDIAAFVIKMHRPASAPANKNAFHGWLNLIVLSARTEGISVFG